MKPFEILGRFTTPDGQELTFHRRDEDFFVYLDGEELMSSRAPGSEIALADLACGQLGPRARVLIGGLGLGFTLRAALDVLPPGATVVVAEIFPSVIEFNRTYLRALQRGALDDRRTTIIEQDVWRVLFDRGPWDAVMLDVDNGPVACCLDANRRLYDKAGLLQIQTALKVGGLLTVWSAQPDPRFVKLLRKSGFDARSHIVRAAGSKGIRHCVFVARRTA